MPGTMLNAYRAQAIAFSQLWVDTPAFFIIVVTMIISTLQKKGQGPKTRKWHVQIFIDHNNKAGIWTPQICMLKSVSFDLSSLQDDYEV